MFFRIPFMLVDPPSCADCRQLLTRIKQRTRAHIRLASRLALRYYMSLFLLKLQTLLFKIMLYSKFPMSSQIRIWQKNQIRIRQKSQIQIRQNVPLSTNVLFLPLRIFCTSIESLHSNVRNNYTCEIYRQREKDFFAYFILHL